jgi:large subunit ribosomal protein L35Ae
MVALKKSQRRAKGKGPVFGENHLNREKKIAQLKAGKAKISVKRARSSPRLYMKATLAGFRRGLNNQRKDTALIRIDDVNTKQDAEFYAGKRVAYVYHGYKVKRCVNFSKAPARRSNTRAVWGRVTKPHGNAGTVRAKFANALPGQAIGKRIRVYLFPSKI